MTQLTDEQQERLKQIRERHNKYKYAYEVETPLHASEDIGFLLSLLNSDSQAAANGVKWDANHWMLNVFTNDELTFTQRVKALVKYHNDAATRMRDQCVEELKKKALSYQKDADNNSLLPNYRKQMAFAAAALREASSAMESLTLDQEQEKQ